MRRLFKFLHEVGAFGVMGALAAHIVLIVSAKDMSPLEYAAVRHAIEATSKYLLLPSLTLVLISGLLAMAIHSPFHNTGWVWIKALTGVMMLEGTLGAVQGTARDAAALSARIASGDLAAEPGMKEVLRHEWGGLWFILLLSAINIALAIWRPRFKKKRETAPASPRIVDGSTEPTSAKTTASSGDGDGDLGTSSGRGQPSIGDPSESDGLVTSTK